MGNFINDDFPLLQISKSAALETIENVISLWPPELAFSDKKFGPDSYMCRSLAPTSRHVRDAFEDHDWGATIEFAGIVLDFVGLAIKQASKYQVSIKLENLDRQMILADIEAREDVVIAP